jgi:hypothetical protein
MSSCAAVPFNAFAFRFGERGSQVAANLPCGVQIRLDPGVTSERAGTHVQLRASQMIEGAEKGLHSVRVKCHVSVREVFSVTRFPVAKAGENRSTPSATAWA